MWVALEILGGYVVLGTIGFVVIPAIVRGCRRLKRAVIEALHWDVGPHGDLSEGR